MSAASQRARASGEPVTVDSLTDTGTLVVANPDGSFTRTESSLPQRVWQRGAWRPIDTTLVVQGDGTLAPKAAVTSVAFGAGGSTTLATLKDGVDTLGFTWPSKLPKPVVSGDTATYPNVLPSVDLQLTADASGYSTVLVIKNAEAAANPALQDLVLGTKAGGHLKLSGSGDGGAQAVDSSTGTTVFHSDTATMWDSTPTTADATADATAGAGSAARSRIVGARAVGAHRAKLKVTTSGGRQTLVLDKSLLSAKSTTYPVYADPEWSGNPSQMDWARISDNGDNVYNSTSKTGDANAREGWDNNNPGNGERAKTYYQMNTSGLKGAVIISSDLYVTQVSVASCSSTPAAVYGTAYPGGWSSSALSWSHQPALQTGVIDTSSSKEGGTCPRTSGSSNSYPSPADLDFKVTSRIATAAADSWNSLTLMVESSNMNDATQWKQLGYGGGATLSTTFTVRPQLKDSTGDPALTPSITDQGRVLTTTHTPTLSARGTDRDGESLHVVYSLYKSDGTLVADGNGPASGNNVNGSNWTTPSLADGDYYWRATLQNASGYWDGSYSGTTWHGTYTANQHFTVDTTAPHAPTVVSTQFPAGQIGGAFSDKGTFTLGNDHTNNVMGYLVSLDADLGSTVYAQNRGTALTTAAITAKTVYFAKADNGTGTGTTVINGAASLTLFPGVTGPHRVYAKAVDQAGSTSPETTYLFYAGAHPAVFAYGDKMVTGYTATNTDHTTTVVPPGTYSSAHGGLITQPSYNNSYVFADGLQGMLANNGAPGIAAGDKAVLGFDIPSTGPWDFGANLTQATDYGIYTLTVDAGQPSQTTLFTGFDAYSSYVRTHYLEMGVPQDGSSNAKVFSKGLHTLTITLTGKNAASGGYQAGIDTLRLSPATTCPVTDTTACLDNTALSTFSGSSTALADIDGGGHSMNIPDLTTTAGWTSAGTVTVDGAAIKLPSFTNTPGVGDNMLASGQTITFPTSGTVNAGNALVFLAYGTLGSVTGATGTLTYASPCNSSTQQTYTLDTVPDWIAGPADAAALTLPHENASNNTQTSPGSGPKVYAVSVPLACPGQTVKSVDLPLWSNGLQTGQSALHILGLGLRPLSADSNRQWVSTWAAAQDTRAVQANPTGSASVTQVLAGQTLRIPAHITLGTAGQVRIHLSNALGKTPVTFDHVTVAPQDPAHLGDTTAAGTTAAATPLGLTFGGAASVTLPAGADAVSDPVTLAALQESTLLVSLHAVGTVSAMPGHGGAQNPVFLSTTSADRTTDTAATNYSTTTINGLPYLTAIDVTTSVANPTGALALYGDQSVNSDTASGDGLHHLSDAIAGALTPDGEPVPYGIVDQGTNSWNAANNLLPSITGDAVPGNAGNPVDRTVLQTANVRTVLLSTGTSDLKACTGTDTAACATGVENKLVALVGQIRSYYTDDLDPSTGTNDPLTLYVATIPPNAGFTADQETSRQAVNAYINDASEFSFLGGHADGAIDFAAAVSTDGTDTSSTVKAADLYNGNPSNSYYADIAAQYADDTAGFTQVAVSPNDGVVSGSTIVGTSEDEWALAADGTDSAGVNPATGVGGVSFGTDAPTSDTAGAGSAAFNGTTSLVKTQQTAVNTQDSYTVSVWVKLNSLGTTSNLAVCQGMSQYQSIYLGYSGNAQAWFYQTTTTTSDGVSDWPAAEGAVGSATAGTWTHLVATYSAPEANNPDSGIMILYVNGSFVDSNVNLSPQYDPSMPLTVGGCINTPDATTPALQFDGRIADVHTYPYALSADEVGALS